MGKSVGIVTLYDPKPNYGNRLQNLAVQTVLEKMGFETVTYSFEKSEYGSRRYGKYGHPLSRQHPQVFTVRFSDRHDPFQPRRPR